MNAQVIWTIEWSNKNISFVAPEPCVEFFAGAKRNADIPLNRCPEDSGVRFAMNTDEIEALCEGAVIIESQGIQDKRATLEPERIYDVRDMRGDRLFRFSIELKDMPPAPTFDRSIELTQERIKFGGSDDCYVRFSQIGCCCAAFELSRQGEGYYIGVMSVPMGVYLNSDKIKPGEKRQLRNGDFIFTSNVVFTYLDGKLLSCEGIEIYNLIYNDRAEQNSHLVYPRISRTTRFHEKPPVDDVEVLDPPNLPEKQQRNLLVSLLPVTGMILLTIFVRGSGNLKGNTMILFSVCSMGMGAVGSIVTYIETNKKFKENQSDRGQRYKDYIAQRREEIHVLREKERQILHRIYIDPESELRNVADFTAELFDRSREDSDFLDLRLGTGQIPSGQKIKRKRHEVFEKTDDLYDLPSKVEEEFKRSHDLPVIIKSSAANAVGFQGDIASMRLMMNQIILDLTTRHYPADVRLYFMCGQDFERQMYAARMMPHVQDNNLGRRNIVHDMESRNLMLETLFKEFTVREENKDYAASAPWIVVFVYADDDLMQHPLMQYITQASSLHVLFLFWAQHREKLPIGCSYLVRLFTNVRSGLLVNMFDREADAVFDYRGVEDRELEIAAQRLAPVYSGETNLSSELVRSLTFLDMPGIDGRISVEDICERWEQADTRKSLAAPLGVAEGGRPVTLDLTEIAHGPHGLVAGTTGSGKSELLISYILSMAYCYSPEDVNFVIIDFKGGGTATQFASLPHLIGTITNLSDSEMMRSLMSIRAEHRRRQQLFNECGVTNINSYTTEYQAGRVKQPLPHLFIIADEFAELKAQQPEFMDELISTSRIGRSLGIHLILATQKPAGVVNDQIWSNSDFKLCLRVQTREDSNEVLRSPLAAEIREPGRAYLQVGRSGIFQLFQSGYSGASIEKEVKSQRAYSLDSRSLSGRRRRIFERRPQKADSKEKKKTQFDLVLSQIIEANKACGYKAPRMLCLPALPEELLITDTEYTLETMYELPIGVYDQPSLQKQDVLTYNLLTSNLLVVGASQMGKTNLLQTILRVASERMSAQDIAFYIMDFNTGVFRTMSKLSVVGGVVTQDQEERFKNLIKLLRQEIVYRKGEIAEHNVTSFRAYRESVNQSMPVIVVMLDNYAAYRELYDENYGTDITYLFREGPSVGISFCVTATRGNLLGARNLSSFAQRILLHIADVNNMSEVIEGCRRRIPEVPGRAVSMINKELLEVQLYKSFKDESASIAENGSKTQIEEFVDAHSQGIKARAIPEVPVLLTRELLVKMFGKSQDPFAFAMGMDYRSVEPVVIQLDRQFELSLVGKNSDGKLLFLKSLMRHLMQPELEGKVRVHIVDHYDQLLSQYENAPCVEAYSTDYNNAREVIKKLHEIAQGRAVEVRQNGTVALRDEMLEVAIINTRDAINAISNDSVAMKSFEELKDQYKQLKILIIFGDLENKAVSFSSPILLRQLRDSRQGLLFESLATGRMYEIDGLTVRENRLTLSKDDAFRVDDGMISHIKVVSG